MKLRIKEEIRILGIDDGAFDKNKKNSKVLVVGVVYRKPSITGILSTSITTDKLNSTNKLIKMINNSHHKNQLRIIMIDGIALGGFNIVDIKKLSNKTALPVIVIIRREPNLKNIKYALRRFKDFKTRWCMIKNAGEIKRAEKIFFQHYNIEEEKACEIINKTSTESMIPEPVRLAHLIAQGISTGDSKGRA